MHHPSWGSWGEKELVSPLWQPRSGPNNTSWRQQDIWGKYFQCFKIKGRVSARAGALSMCSSCAGFLASAVLSAPEPPRASGVRWGHSHERDTQPIPDTAQQQNCLKTNCLWLVKWKVCKNVLFPSTHLPWICSTAGAELLLCFTPLGPSTLHCPFVCISMNKEISWLLFQPLIHIALQNSLQDHLDAEQMQEKPRSHVSEGKHL